jgi:serine phosphatase RsbU (regulator of sigma subunit)
MTLCPGVGGHRLSPNGQPVKCSEGTLPRHADRSGDVRRVAHSLALVTLVASAPARAARIDPVQALSSEFLTRPDELSRRPNVKTGMEATTLSAEFRYGLLLEISQRISRTFDLQTVLAQLLESLRLVVDYDAAGIFVLNRSVRLARDARFLIAGMATVGFAPNPRPDDTMLRDGRGIVGHVITTGRSVVAPDVRLDRRYVEGRRTTLSEIAVPIFANGDIIGALNLESNDVDEYSQADVPVLEFFAAAAGTSIEKAVLHREVIERQQLADQLNLAREVQANLLPVGPPPIPGYDLAATNLPSSEIGGDYYDYIPLENGQIALVVADVAGKGIPAALIMAGFRAALRTELRKEADPIRIVGELNRHVLESAGVSRFVTAIYGVLEPSTGRLRYVNCGHNAPLLLHSDGRHEFLESGGPALGLPWPRNFQQATVTLHPGDVLALYTDGVVELTDGDDGDFGLQRLMDVLRRSSHLPARQMIQDVIDTTRAFAERDSYEDDFTLVIAKRDGYPHGQRV